MGEDMTGEVGCLGDSNRRNGMGVFGTGHEWRSEKVKEII